MLSVVDLIDYIDSEIKVLSDVNYITPTGQSSATGAITALKQIRKYIEVNSLLVNNVDHDENHSEQDK
jgi:hypothetical protein